MKYTKIQKFLSSFLMFSLLFSTTFKIPFLNFSVFAGDEDFYNIVSVIINEKTYSKIKDEVKRYSKDISGVLENTKVVILPVRDDSTAFNISSMNESLYFDGYKGLSDVSFESKLIGSVFIGDLPLPIVSKQGESLKTILPYTDFEDKSYIYNSQTGKYEYNSDNLSGVKPEIWHGVISPNNGDFDLDIKSLKDYFDKNNDFYNGEGFYNKSKGVINGVEDEETLDDYEPYVFYFDSFRESKALNYNSYIGYEGYLENKEDISYSRYTKELASKLKEELLGNSNKEILSLAKKVDPSLDETLFENIESNLENTPDIQSRYIINNSVKKFLEIFSKGSIGDLRKDVFNSGRYNLEANEVGVDFIPYLISVLDLVNDEIIKDINNELENEIDNLVANGLSRKIAVPTIYHVKDSSRDVYYENYLFGKKASNLENAVECSFYRGSMENGGNLVEANRGLNINNIEKDKDSLNTLGDQTCFNKLQSGESLNGYWGYNSPFNLDDEATGRGELKLESSDYKGAIVELFDIAGSKKIEDITKTPNPFMCLDNNYLLAENNQLYTDPFGGSSKTSTFVNTYVLPTFSRKSNYPSSPFLYETTKWTCLTDTNSSNYNSDLSFDEIFTGGNVGKCERKIIKVDGVEVKRFEYNEICTIDGCECSSATITNNDGTQTTSDIWKTHVYEYKTVDSYIKHKSATSDELGEEINSMIAPSLPVDKNRYIDFISAKGKYSKINYPYLYRVKVDNNSEVSLEKIKEKLDQILDDKSKEINEIISGSRNYSGEGTENDFYEVAKNLSAKSKFIDNEEINNILLTGSYPSDNFSLKDYLKNKGTKTLDIDGEKKDLSYYDILAFSIYWNNLNSVSAKYGFVFENYLSDQFSNEDTHFLPKNKKLYEIAYLGSEGDASSMYIGLNPENKSENPYSEVIQANQDLSTKLLGSNIGSNLNSENTFKCAPPEGVPIWEWIPAIMCRLGEMMPPTISISDGSCGATLLSNEEKEELNSCNGDIDKNGVNDCLENKLSDGILALKSDSDKYYYNTKVDLTSVIKGSDNKKLGYISSTDIAFDIVKLEKVLDSGKSEIVYDIDDPFYNDKNLLNKYINFKSQKVRAQGGEAKYGLNVKNEDVDIYLESNIKLEDASKQEVLSLDSNTLKIKVRGERLFASNFILSNSDNGLSIQGGINGVLASDKTNIYFIDGVRNNLDGLSNIINNNSISEEKMVIKLENISKSGKIVPISYPLNLKLEKNNKVIKQIKLNSGDLSNFKELFSLKEVGNYELEILDSAGASTKKSFIVKPGAPDSLDLNLGTSVMQKGGSISTNFVTILDRFKNPVSGEYFDIKMELDGEGVEFLDNEKQELFSSTYEGYKIFRLKSSDEIGENKINISVFNTAEDLLVSSSKKISVFEDFKINLKSQTGKYKVGGEENKFQIEVRDLENNIIKDFDSRVYMVANPIFVDVSKPYFEIKNGVGIIDFKTKTLSEKNIPLEFQIEGLNKIITKTIEILPEEAVKIDLVLSKSKMEAKDGDYSNLNIELKDRYNNIAFNDNSTNTSIEIQKQYADIISSDKKSSIVKGGKTSYKIYSTNTPGIGFFKISTNNSLSENSFFIEDESGKIEISGVGENAGKIETFYVWNKSKIEKGNYNSLYTTLLGSNYGDIDQKDYLAGSIIFDEDSKALAVTSLLNKQGYLNNILSISYNGGLDKLVSPSDLSQDINFNVGFEDGKISIDLYNEALNNYIGKIYYNFSEDTDLEVCENEIEECLSNNKNTTIFGKTLDENFGFYTGDNKLYFRDKFGKTYFEIDSNGKINRKANLEFDLDFSAINNNFGINIKSGDDKIGYLGFDFIDSKISTTRDENVFQNKKEKISNAILVYLNSSFYGFYESGKTNNSSLVLYYNDPFSSKNSLNNFSKDNIYGYENFVNKKGLGWSEGNKTLLSFSSGKNVGESLQDFMSVSSINIGDPVISLNKRKNKFKNTTDYKQFDSTTGEIVNIDSNLKNYKIFDYNNDGLDDLLLIKNDNYLKLLENKNTHQRFLDKGNLAHLVDLGSSDLVFVGDFTGDLYDDVFFVGDDGKPYILNNINKDFSRLSLENKFKLNGRIIRAEVFDMDNDSIDDIVTLDDEGEINIFYGGGVSANPIFTKLKVSDDYGIKLSSSVRSDGALVYFDGLYQMDSGVDNSDLLAQNEEYILSLEKSINEDFEVEPRDKVDYDLINSFVFEQVAYGKTDFERNEQETLENELLTIPETLEQTTFIKGEYSEISGIKVEKTLKDVNGGYLKTGDVVDVEIKLINNSGKKVNNVAYMENILEYFTLQNNLIKNSKDLVVKKPNNSYDFLIDDFSLENKEEFIINYSTTVKPLSYSYIKVGLFEKGESDDDKYGDIILQESYENCSKSSDIFRSASTRVYVKGLKNLSCDNSDLPEAIEQNILDSDNNGIPDYIELLTKSSEERKKYSEETLYDLYKDDDNDGIPNDEDSFNSSQSITLDLGALGENIDSGLDNLQSFVNGLSCGFSNGACIATPLNWAPLAPGSDPTFNGSPIGDGLNIGEGYPIFSSLTGLQTTCGTTPCCLPSVWPPMSAGFIPGTTCGPDSAGGELGILNPTNTFRLFVTPTLTGGVGMAACFGGPAKVAGYSNMPGISPLFPGGNCIVVAKPIVGCSNDGSDGDPSSLGYPYYGDSFGVISGNCDSQETYSYLDTSYVNNYYDHLTGNKSFGGIQDFNGAISDHSTSGAGPLFEVGGSGTPISISVDPDSNEVDFSDIEQFSQKRVKAFPGFLMNWVTRQIEEIVNKLTDFPTVFVILPDFSGIYDSDLSWEDNRNNWLENSGNKDEIGDIVNIDSNFSGEKNNEDSIDNKLKTHTSGIKEAYEFIGSLPLVNIEQETVDIELPWISSSEIDKTISTRGKTIDSRKAELGRAQDSWSLGSSCSYYDENKKYDSEKEKQIALSKQKKCEEEYGASDKIIFEITGLISSLEANLEAIKEYKNIPEKINKLINKKEDYLEQILCNIESISEILGGRIGKNGERFKSWVELYILIKAILKSWQLLIDVFVDYEEECKECKNERQDLLTYEFELISMVVPDIPVIQFPKWPDIIIDLHNIRAGLDVALPEFNIVSKPILLPELPALYLPEAPNLNIALNLPEIPVLPVLEIPELPDLPSLPSVELPDLPPPPTLPKMFAELEGILDILKLVTKAMCILKSSPFVPEWRAGDQIAFLTERNGYLATDFLNLDLPQFSFPFIDAIKVTSYVNLEFETDFIVELARQIAMPINTFTSDFTNMFDISTNALDFRYILPGEIDVNIGEDGSHSNGEIIDLVGFILKKNLLNGPKYLEANKDELVSNNEFKKEISKNLSSDDFVSDLRLDSVREIWKNVESYTFSKENKIIDKLKEEKFSKFELVKDIINTEIIKNKEFKKEFNSFSKTNIKKVSLAKDSNIEDYNLKLSKYNSKVFENTSKLLNYNEDTSIKRDIKDSGEALLAKADTALSKYNKVNNSNLLAADLTSNNTGASSCSASANEDYSYNYEGIYILENNKSYRLFDYLDELSGKESTKIIDFDNDEDEDLLYLVDNTLYLKENLSNKAKKVYLNENPIVLESKNNKFINGEYYHQSVNNISEKSIDSSIINIGFKGVSEIFNYRLSFYTLVDKLLNEKSISYRPEFKKKTIVDSIAGVGDVNLVSEEELYTGRKDLAYIDKIGDLRGVQVETDEMVNIKDNLKEGSVVSLSSGTKVYSGDSTLVLKYRGENDQDIKTIILPKHRNIEIKSTIKIVGITGNGYIKTGNKIKISGADIRSLIGKPLFIGTKISYVGNNFEVRDDTYMEIKYYDDSSLSLDFEYISSWELYDLGKTGEDYFISVEKNNDYYYGIVNGFKNDILSTSSKQILLSPQIRADNNSPELNFDDIRVPVYQSQKIDISDYIYDDYGIIGIKELYIDFDLENDLDGDGNNKNDNDSNIMENLKVSKTEESIYLEVGEFDEIFTKKIGITIIDQNDNYGYAEVSFEIYSPVPNIQSYEENKIKGVINEDLTKEPVSLYRYRGGVINKLSNESGNNLSFTNNGEYDFEVGNTSSGITIKDNNEDIAYINEKTGQIVLNNKLSYSIEVEESDSKNNSLVYPRISINNSLGEVFYETIKVSGNNKVNIVEDFESVQDLGLYVQFLNKANYNYYSIPENVSYNAGSVSIYRITDTSKESLFTIFKDGRINTINENYSLEYENFNEYVVIKLVDKHFNREVARVLYKVESDYVIK